MEFTNDKLSVLQNLEFSVAEVWRASPEMTDYSALRAYEAAFQKYRADLRGHAPKPHGLTGLDAVTFDVLERMCEIRLARKPGPGESLENVPPIPLQLLVDCLRELAKSVERHTAAGGRQGYLNFIDQFLP